MVLCSLLWIGLAITIILGWFFETPFYPSRTKDFKKVLDQLNYDLNGKNFLDLGSGDGRFVVFAARNGAKAEGIEINPYLSLFAKLIIFLTRTKNAKILNKNFKNHDFSKYDIVYTYIFKEYIDLVKDKMFEQMKPGSIIVSKIFTMSDVEPDQKIGQYKIYKVK